MNSYFSYHRSGKLFLLTLFVCLLGIGNAAAKDAYAVYNSTTRTLTFYYDDNKSTRPNQVYDLNTDNSTPAWHTSDVYPYVTTVTFDDSFKDYRPTSTAKWFWKMDKLERIEKFFNLYTENVTTMQQMFMECEKLDLNFQSNLTDGNPNHTNGTRFDTKNVTNMSAMFDFCTALTYLDLSGWNTSMVETMEDMFSRCSNLTSIKLGSVGRSSNTNGWNTWNVTNMSKMFYDCKQLYSIYVGTGWNTENVTNSENMFYGCTNLSGSMLTRYNANYIDKTRAHVDGGQKNPGYLSSTLEAYVAWTANNTTLTFYYDEWKDYLSEDTYVLDNNRGWLENAASVTRVVFDTSFKDVCPTTTGYWFFNMKLLTTIEGLENLNTSEVSNMRGMFMDCKSLTTLDLSTFDTSSVGYTTDMFNGCSSLQRIIVSDTWTMKGALTNAQNSNRMFANCTSLVGGAGTVFDASHVDASYACVDGSAGNTGYLTGPAYTEYNASTKTLTFYNDGKRYLKSGIIYELVSASTTSSGYPEWYDISNSIDYAVFDASFATARPLSMYKWFCMYNLKTITNIHYLNTSEVRDMRETFSNTQNLTSLDLGCFNTEKVTDMTSMFQGCKLEELDLSSFNTQNVTSMKQMFAACLYLETIFASGTFTTDKVTESTSMFYGCNKLCGSAGTSFDSNHTDKTYARVDGGTFRPGYFSDLGYVVLTGRYLYFYYDNKRSTHTEGTVYSLNKDAAVVPEWTQDGLSNNVEIVIFDQSFANARPLITGSWFNDMPNLYTIFGMEYLNTSETVNMNSMFEGCKSLYDLDLIHLNTKKVTNMGLMFSGCTALKTIYVGDGWNTDNVTESYHMFYNCTSLVGGLGTAYSSSNVGVSYARADTEYEPGYLSFNPYVVITSDGMMTFYCDGKNGQREGSEFGLNEWPTLPKWVEYADLMSINYIEFDPSFANARPNTTSFWFSGIKNLRTIYGMEYLNTSEVVYMDYMFSYTCSQDYYLNELDLSYFDTSKLKSTDFMFSHCSKLKTIIVGDKWSMENVTRSTYMFEACEDLTGGAGTTYDDSYMDKRYAHVDGGTSNPGYLTGISTQRYGIKIGGVEITAANYKRITPSNGFTAIKGGTVQFYPETSELFLGDATISEPLESGTPGITINTVGSLVLSGSNSVSGYTGLIVEKDVVISGLGEGTFIGCDIDCGIYVTNFSDEVTLTIRNTNVNVEGKWGIAGRNGRTEDLIIDNSTVHATATEAAIADLKSMQLKECRITDPADAAWNSTNMAVCTSSGTIVKELTIMPSSIRGDVNSDGNVTPADAIMILYHYFNVVQAGFDVNAADVNDDGNISPADAIEALYIYFGAGSNNARVVRPTAEEAVIDPE